MRIALVLLFLGTGACTDDVDWHHVAVNQGELCVHAYPEGVTDLDSLGPRSLQPLEGDAQFMVDVTVSDGPCAQSDDPVEAECSVARTPGGLRVESRIAWRDTATVCTREGRYARARCLSPRLAEGLHEVLFGDLRTTLSLPGDPPCFGTPSLIK